jgi:hypothetical protein
MASRNTAKGMRVEVLLDGRRLAIAGVEEFGVLSAIVTWVKRSPAQVAEMTKTDSRFDKAELLREECKFDVSGLGPNDKNLSWGRETLQPGSELTIRILGPGQFDPPAKR